MTISKEEEALRLYESGIEADLLTERFAVSRGAIGRWLRKARKNRDKVPVQEQDR